ncbi:MAG TPA: hypothetical protein VIU93_10130 [Gallionellaceae bacterium]
MAFPLFELQASLQLIQTKLQIREWLFARCDSRLGMDVDSGVKGKTCHDIIKAIPLGIIGKRQMTVNVHSRVIMRGG